MFEPPLVFESIPPRPGDLKLSAAHSHPGKENMCGGEPVRVIETATKAGVAVFPKVRTLLEASPSIRGTKPTNVPSQAISALLIFRIS
jgi:hypothetical protein